MNEHLLDGVLVRGALALAISISAGPVLWAWLVERRRAGPLARWRVITTTVLLTSAGVLAVVQATFAFAERWSVVEMWIVLTDTTYGRVLSVHLATSLGHGIALVWRGAAGDVAILATGLAAALTLTLLGHASVQAAWHVGIQLVHTSAAVVWLGLLVVLMEHLARRTAELAAILRLSRIAAGAVAILVVTGVMRTASFVLGGGEAVEWFAVLVLKLVLIAGALALAAGHRRSRFYGLRDRETEVAWRRFHTLLTLECWLVACALLVAALLSQLPPP